MPLQNRVTPAGEIVAVNARGTFMGNRGILHNQDGQLVRSHRNTMWLICLLEFRGRRRTVMSPGTYTELFFLDEAVALAAGHRPCGECRRRSHRAFIDALNTETHTVDRARDLDRLLHRSRQSVPVTAAVSTLPDGTFILFGDNDFRLTWQGRLHRWSPDGYHDPVDAADTAAEVVRVLTPALSVTALRHGYPVEVHPSTAG